MHRLSRPSIACSSFITRSFARCSSVSLTSCVSSFPSCLHPPHRSAIVPPRVTSTREVIVKLLQNIGSKKEVEQYLKYYSSLDAPKFAVIKVGGGNLLEEMDTLTESLSFLASVGLLPVVIHGAGPQINAELEKQKIDSEYINGMRITTAEILGVVRKEFQKENLRLVKALEDRGTRARSILTGVFQAELLDFEKLGYVGQMQRVDPFPVYLALEAGQLPILTCMGETSSGQSLNVNADVAAQELAKALKPAKIVYLSTKGGLKDEQGNLMTVLDLETDYEKLMNEPWFKHGDRLKLKEIKTLLDELPPSSSVAITSAANLPKELFTHKGSGTLVKRSEKFQQFTSIDQINQFHVRTLLESSFSGELDKDYFEQIRSSIHRIFLSERTGSIAIVTKDPSNPLSIPYLDKFAVSKDNQSEGAGNALWQVLRKEIPQMYWRSRSTNNINSWYFERSGFSFQPDNSEWIIFAYGIGSNWTLLNQLVNKSLSKKPSIRRLDANDSNGTIKASVSSSTASLNVDGRRSFSSSSIRSRARVGLIGARGYTGGELLNLSSVHPHLDLTVASSRALKGQRLSSAFPSMPKSSWSDLEISDLHPSELAHQPVDLWVLALPNNLAHPYVEALDKAGAKQMKLVDLSADYRFDPKWIYGLVERPGQRAKIAAAQRISNPGCYATGMQMALLPIADSISPDSPPVIFGISGYSGAGTTPSRKNDPKQLKHNLMPYTLQHHMHEKEVSFQFSNQLPGGVRFLPHVAPWFRGISLTIAVQIRSDLAASFTKEKLATVYRQYYQGEPLIEYIDEIPEVRDSQGHHGVRIGGISYDSKTGRLVVCTTIDNLLKGAATQCMQNMNLALGFRELDGIK
jgi:N-acetyl-gamma-glutamyl-phosphate reductase/acetylglutamate kinase